MKRYFLTVNFHEVSTDDFTSDNYSLQCHRPFVGHVNSLHREGMVSVSTGMQ